MPRAHAPEKTLDKQNSSLRGFAEQIRPCEVIEGDTIVGEQLVGLHGIDALDLDQTFWWRGQHIACGTCLWPQVGVGGVGARVSPIFDGLRRR
jgi:hypothetical protein